MEENRDLSLFEMHIDLTSKQHLSDAARWGRFLAMLGFIHLKILFRYLGIAAIVILSVIAGGMIFLFLRIGMIH